MIYVSAGLFAEGTTDYRFLVPLLDRLLDERLAELFPGAYEVGPTRGIDAPSGVAGRRTSTLPAAIEEEWESCTLFVIHTDGAGDPEQARRSCVEPGLGAARAAAPERAIVAVACIPVREIEAWLLTDPEAFRTVLGASAAPVLPADPEREADPKATLRRVLAEGGSRRTAKEIYAIFGERVRLSSLRALPAFRAFEAELDEALGEVARLQGHRG